jgi:hypothetical protein
MAGISGVDDQAALGLGLPPLCENLGLVPLCESCFESGNVVEAIARKVAPDRKVIDCGKVTMSQFEEIAEALRERDGTTNH